MKKEWKENAIKLSKSLSRIENVEYIEDLSKYIEFEWDVRYAFAPYISEETIYKTVGYIRNTTGK